MNQWRVDEAWTDGVDPYQILGMVDGVAASEANYGGFGCAICGCSRSAGLSIKREVKFEREESERWVVQVT